MFLKYENLNCFYFERGSDLNDKLQGRHNYSVSQIPREQNIHPLYIWLIRNKGGASPTCPTSGALYTADTRAAQAPE